MEFSILGASHTLVGDPRQPNDVEMTVEDCGIFRARAVSEKFDRARIDALLTIRKRLPYLSPNPG